MSQLNLNKIAYINFKRIEPSLEGVECPEEIQDIFAGFPPGITPDAWLKGRTYYARNIYNSLRREESASSINVYLFYGDPSRNLPALGHGCEEQRRWIIDQLIEDRPGNYDLAQRKRIPFENRRLVRTWRQRIFACVPVMVDSTPTQQLLASLAALKAFLFTSPTEEDASNLRAIIRQLRGAINTRTRGPQFIKR